MVSEISTTLNKPYNSIHLIEVSTYNSLLLSEKLLLAGSEREKQKLLERIRLASTQSWAHINLAGEYDFSSGKSCRSFDINALKALSTQSIVYFRLWYNKSQLS